MKSEKLNENTASNQEQFTNVSFINNYQTRINKKNN